jgi:Receptor family ligand binding region
MIDRITVVAFLLVVLVVATNAATQKHQVVRVGFIPSATDGTNNGAFQARYPSQLAGFLLAIADMRAKWAATNITIEFAIRDAQSRFSTASQVLSSLSTTAFKGGFPAHGVIGSDTTAVSSGIAYTCNDFDMGQISYGSDAAFLSSGSMFPSFLRNIQSNCYEALAMYATAR